MVHGLSCPLACGILVPSPGIELVSPALAGRFLTTVLPGKSMEATLLEQKDCVVFLGNRKDGFES